MHASAREPGTVSATFLLVLNAWILQSCAAPAAVPATPENDVRWTSQAAARSEGIADIQDFGAVPDARYYHPEDGRYYADSARTTPATDNTSAIQAAVESLRDPSLERSGGIVFVPKGQYLTGPIVVHAPARVHFEGVGRTSRLILKAGSDDYLLTFRDAAFTLADLVLDGNRAHQASGGCLRLHQPAHFVKVRDARLTGCAEYALFTTGGGQQTFDNVQFKYSGIGAYSRYNTALHFVSGTAFEDNDAGGLVVEGGPHNGHVVLDGVYFEDNARNSEDVAYHVRAFDVESQTLGREGTQMLRLTNSYLNGARSRGNHGGISIQGSGVDHWIVRGNEFRDLERGALHIPSHSPTAVGTNDFRMNSYTGSTPPPVHEPGSLDLFGYLTAESVSGRATVGPVPLRTGARGVLHALSAPSLLRIRSLSVRYVDAREGLETAVLEVGHAEDPRAIYAGPLPSPPSGRRTVDITDRLSTRDLRLPGGGELVFRVRSGGSQSPGDSIVFQLDYVDF